MKLPQIQLESQMARIDIQQTSGTQVIKQAKADLSIKQPKANLSIRTTPSKLTIDQSGAWEDMNVRSTLSQTARNASDAYQRVLKGIGRKAQQGKELMKIENGGNPIKSQAIINGHVQQKEIGLTYIPSRFAVKIHYKPGTVIIDARVNQPIIHARINKPEIVYQKGAINTRLQQYHQLKIDVIK